MGLKFLDGSSWSDVTREERFFCLQLFNRIQEQGVRHFVRYLNDISHLDLNAEANWELAYEACFYRDSWWHRGCNGSPFSPKRTFDLCLLWDDEIVVIEAKAQQTFEGEQLDVFTRDREQIPVETGVRRILLVGLASSLYSVPEEIAAVFDGTILTWAALAKHYGDDPILKRADAIFGDQTGRTSGTHNTSGKMSGQELLDAYDRGDRFFVGRGQGGLHGRLLNEDVATGRWRFQRYETNSDATQPPSSNWFRLSEFVQKVRGDGQRDG